MCVAIGPYERNAATTHLKDTDLTLTLCTFGLTPVSCAETVFVTNMTESIAWAQRLLLTNGYRLHGDAVVIPGYSYVTTYLSPYDDQHGEIRLILVGDGSLSFPRVLAFYDADGHLAVFTHRSGARYLPHGDALDFGTISFVDDFARLLPGKSAFWTPVFDGSPVADL